MVGWRSIRLQSPSFQGLLLTFFILGTIVGAPMLLVLSPLYAQTVLATSVQLIDPHAQLVDFDAFYQQVLARARTIQYPNEAVSWRVFPLAAFKQHEPYELAAYVKLSHIGLSPVLEGTKVQLLIEIFPDDVEQLRALFEHGVAPLIHVIRVHIPSELSVEDRVDEWIPFFHELRRIVRHYGGNAEIWVQRTQRSLTNAERMREHLLLRHSGADKVNVSSLSSVALRQTSSSLAALAVDVTAAKQLENHTYLGHLELGDGIWALVFARNGVPILVTWSVDGLWTLELPGVTERVEVVNLYGQTTAAMVQQDRLRLSIGPEPIFIRGLGGSLVARVFLESGVDRLGNIIASASSTDAGADGIAELIALTHATATDIWHAHAQSVHEMPYLADAEIGGGRIGWQTPTVMAPFETERPPQPDSETTLKRWERVMTRLFARTYGKVATEPEKRAWRLGELDALPLLVELIAALGHPWGGDEAQGYVAGTGMLVHEAAAFLNESTHGHGYRSETDWLLNRALDWLDRAENGDTGAATAAWAIIARETAVLAVERSLTETPLADDLLLAAPLIELEYRMGGLSDDRRDLPAGNASLHPLDVPLFGVFVRSLAADKQGEWQLRVGTPSGWLWQTGSQAVRMQSGESAPAVVSSAGQPYLFADTLGLVPLHLRLLVPSDTRAGRYPVHISLIDPASGRDAITLYVTIR